MIPTSLPELSKPTKTLKTLDDPYNFEVTTFDDGVDVSVTPPLVVISILFVWKLLHFLYPSLSSSFTVVTKHQ